MALRDITQPTITEYLDQLDTDKHKLVTFLNNAGLPSSDNQTFTYLIPKLDFIPTGNIDVGAAGIKFGYSTWIQIADNLDFSNATDFQWMFYSNESLTSLPNTLDTSKATTMESAFNSCKALGTIPLINTSLVTNMSGMFNADVNLLSIPLINTSNVTNMSNMFYGCTRLTTVPALNASSATNMGNMFRNCTSLTDETLNNILAICISATSYAGTKTLQELGLRSNSYSAARIQALSNYSDFTTAGWTIGY